MDLSYIYVQAQSTCDDSNSVSDNEEDISNNESILNSVKAEPSDMMNDLEHRNTFPAALLSLQGNMQGNYLISILHVYSKVYSAIFAARNIFLL